MDKLRPRKKQKKVAQHDTDEENSSDVDWSPEADETNQIQAPDDENDKSLPEDIEFDSTEVSIKNGKKHEAV